MDVQAGDRCTDPLQSGRPGDAGGLGGGEIAAYGVEQEGSRAAAGIEHRLVLRVGDDLVNDGLGQLVWGVVFAEAVALLGIDDRFIKHLHHVVLDVLPSEAGQAAGQSANEGIATGDINGPVKEVRLDDPADLGLGKQPPGEQRGRTDTKKNESFQTDSRVVDHARM
jgi:hypothetical protein